LLSGLRRFPSLLLVAISAVVFASALDARAAAPTGAAASTLAINGLDKGTAPIDGPWQFHLGDNAAWANPAIDGSGWEQLTADKSWGAQSHPSYTGFAW
jgi:diguanylate cyclase